MKRTTAPAFTPSMRSAITDLKLGQLYVVHAVEVTFSLEKIAKDVAEPDNFFRMGTPSVMVDIMPRITGVDFEEAWSRRVDVQIDDDLSVPFVTRQDLFIAKLAAGQAQDLIDVDALRESSRSQEIDQERGPPALAKSAQDEFEKIRKRGATCNCEARRAATSYP